MDYKVCAEQPDFSISWGLGSIFDKPEEMHLATDMGDALALIAKLHPDQIVVFSAGKSLAYYNPAAMIRYIDGKRWRAQALFDPKYPQWDWQIECPEIGTSFAMVEGAPPDPRVIIDKIEAERAAKSTTRTNKDLGKENGRI